MEWSPAHPITLDRNPADHLEKKAGVYRVCATLGNGNALPVHQALGVDREGILYIGGTGDLKARIGDLAHIPRDPAPPDRHDLIDSWLRFDFDRLANRTQLVVQWRECRDHVTEERKLLINYKMTFGDIPPGNLKLDRVPA